MGADASFHADQARRYIGEPRFHLATRPLLPQHDGAARIVAHDVERVLADIDADHGDRGIGCLRHGVLLCLWRPLPASLAGGAGGWTIPLADNRANVRVASYHQPRCIGGKNWPPPRRGLLGCGGLRWRKKRKPSSSCRLPSPQPLSSTMRTSLGSRVMKPPWGWSLSTTT